MKDGGAPAGRPGTERPGFLAPFEIRSFRFQWPADLSTSWAAEMENLILAWYVLVETESVLLLTLFGALQYLGTLIAPLFGLAGDRIGHRTVLCCMRAAYALLASSLAACAAAGALGPVPVFVVACLAGLIRSSDLVMRNSLVGETMPADRLMGAMGIARTTNDSARVAGALAGAGLVASVGIGRAYMMIAALYALSFLLTLGVARSGRRADAPAHASPWRDLRQAGDYVWATPHLLAALCLAFLVNLTAYPLSGGLLPYVAKDIYGTGQSGLGYLVASFAAGALVGSLAISRHRGALRPGRMMIVSGVLWYAALLMLAQTRSMAGGIVALALAGFLQSLCLVPLAVMLLRCTEPQLRGCVMGLRMLAVYGLPLGLLAAGPLIQFCGFATTATLSAAVGLACTVLIGWYWRAHVWRRDAPANSG